MIEVHERFNVPADPDRVWAIVSDPEAVVTCIPGATLEERHEDGSYSGSMLVQFGPAKVKFNARVTFERDEMARVGRVTGRGKDAGGGTRATMAFTFTVSEDTAGSAVAGDGEVDIKGPLAGMIETGASFVIKRMLSEFSARLTERCAAGRITQPVELPSAQPEAQSNVEGWWRRLLDRLWATLGRIARKLGPNART